MTPPSDNEFRDYLESAKRGDVKALRRFLSSHPGAVDDRPWFTDTTALKEACAWAHRDAIEFLLDAGADINKCDSVNMTTPLMSAAMADKDCAILLLDRGADMERKNSIGMTALTIVSSIGKTDAAELLLDRGANIHAGAERGFTPLRAAVYHEHPLTAEILLERGAVSDIDLRDGLDMTPLMWTAGSGSAHMVRLLLSYGAKTDLRNPDNETAADIAERKHYPEIARMIRSGVAPVKKKAVHEAPSPAAARDAALARLKKHAHEKKLKPR